MQALSVQNRVLGVIGAVEAGIALWYFTNGHWMNGAIVASALAFLISVYLHRVNKTKEQRGRRY